MFRASAVWPSPSSPDPPNLHDMAPVYAWQALVLHIHRSQFCILGSGLQSHHPPHSQCPLTARTHHISGHGVLCGPPRVPRACGEGMYSPPGATSQHPPATSRTRPVFLLHCACGVKHRVLLEVECPPPELPAKPALSVCSLISSSPALASPTGGLSPHLCLMNIPALCPLRSEQCLSLSKWRTPESGP